MVLNFLGRDVGPQPDCKRIILESHDSGLGLRLQHESRKMTIRHRERGWRAVLLGYFGSTI